MFLKKKKQNPEANCYLKRPLSMQQWDYLKRKFSNNPIVEAVLKDIKPEYLHVRNQYEHGLMIYFSYIYMRGLEYRYSDYGYSKLDYNTTRELAYYIANRLNIENYGVCAITHSTYSPGTDFYTDTGLHVGRATETFSKIGAELYIQIELKEW